VPRIEYPAEHFIDLQSDEHGLLARIVVRLLVVTGKRVRWAVALQVRRKDGRFRDVVRYDDWHGPLHRHDPRASTRQPGKPVLIEPMPGVDSIHQAIAEIELRADGYIALATKYDDLEAEDDDDENT
jgi:hypothetical protein